MFTPVNERDSWREIYRELEAYMLTEDGKKFLNIPFQELKPADCLFQSLMLEIKGDYENTQIVETSALRDLYTREYNECWEKQATYVTRTLAQRPTNAPVVDIASGLATLVEFIAARINAPIVVTDISPTILKRDKRILQLNHLEDRVDLLAFDIRRMPFKDSSLSAVTTNLGFQNVSDKTGDVDGIIIELSRVLNGKLMGIFDFYDPEDQENRKIISELGLEWSFYRGEFLSRFEKTGLKVGVKNVCLGRKNPTPVGEYFKEATIDTLPVKTTSTEWCTIEADSP